eukprot:789842-Prorocentrum_minimum.AAC.1
MSATSVSTAWYCRGSGGGQEGVCAFMLMSATSVSTAWYCRGSQGVRRGSGGGQEGVCVLTSISATSVSTACVWGVECILAVIGTGPHAHQRAGLRAAELLRAQLFHHALRQLHVPHHQNVREGPLLQLLLLLPLQLPRLLVLLAGHHALAHYGPVRQPVLHRGGCPVRPEVRNVRQEQPVAVLSGALVPYDLDQTVVAVLRLRRLLELVRVVVQRPPPLFMVFESRGTVGGHRGGQHRLLESGRRCEAPQPGLPHP